jgi:3-dehydrosphinganine reductase
VSADQTLTWHSFSLTSAQDSASALDAASAAHGRCPDAVFLCAGASKPGFFIEEDEASLRAGMDSAYWVQAWTALAAAKRMVRDGVRGKIAFVSSVVGYMSIAGYSNYAPGKHALRGSFHASHPASVAQDMQVWPRHSAASFACTTSACTSASRARSSARC